MSSDLNRALRSAGPREIAPLSLTEVKSRASRWRIQRFALMGAAASLVIAGAVGAWAAIDLGGGSPTVPVAPNDSAELVAVPDLIGVSFREACNNVEGELILRVENSSTTETCDSGSIVTAQEPKPGTHVEPGTGIAITLSPIKEPPDENDRVLDGLIIELRVEEEMVQPGATVRSTLIVENPTDEPIVDPQCYLASPTFGIVKSVDAELWQAHVVDCGARLTIAPGEMKRMTGPDFIATDGMDPLEPGSYLAVVELRGRTERLSLPIEVVE